MPYAIMDKQTGQLLACPQVNGYQLPYFGVVLRDAAPSDAELREELRRAGESGAPEAWIPVELTEHEAKMANVKLRNDTRRKVYLRDGRLVSTVPEQSG
ncbi:hypothetical protein GE107_18915 [Cohnella sp. CFH 77786]|uniref:hypothetical protein n=1 Tax=Cohnella sp. CFH 77786 TaxID=2662265 RepID=UPI001C60B045|nr:hypothetical protein [Cohnella sp. CFH 77786]MBW5448133.1 hypothetical protein [Cohnella sp. CFH 77786]